MVEESENKAGDAAAGTSQMMKDHSQRNVRKMGWRLWPLRMTLNASVKTAGKRVSRRAQHRNIPQNIWKLWCFFVRLRKSCRTGIRFCCMARWFSGKAMPACSQPQAEPENPPIFLCGENIWAKVFGASMETRRFFCLRHRSTRLRNPLGRKRTLAAQHQCPTERNLHSVPGKRK